MKTKQYRSERYRDHIELPVPPVPVPPAPTLVERKNQADMTTDEQDRFKLPVTAFIRDHFRGVMRCLDPLGSVRRGRGGAPKAIATWLTTFSIFLFATGCASFTVSNKHGKDSGIPYYLPKPYLLITKNVTVVQPTAKPPAAPEEVSVDRSEGTSISSSSPSVEPKYAIQIIYLPDLREGPQRIKMAPGTGTVDADLALANGWQLIKANVKLNSKIPETLKETGALVGELAKFAPTPAAAGKGIADIILELIKKNELTTADLEITAEDFRMLKPGIWLFEMNYNETKGCIEFLPIKCFNAFEFKNKCKNKDTCLEYETPWGVKK